MTPNFKAYAHYGSPNGPFLTEQVQARYKPRAESKRTSKAVYFDWQVKTAGKWRNVYADVEKRLFVRVKKERVKIQLLECCQ